MQTPTANVVHLRGAAGMDAIYRKVSWRLLPLLMLCYALVCLDRINLGIAQQQMQHSLAFSAQVYAWGAALFLVGCCLCALPVNLMLQRNGARTTLLRLMLCWAVVSAATAMVRTPTQFYVLRFALGAAEAGLFPGLIVYLSWWYPAPRRARAFAILASAALLAAVVAAPLADATLAALRQAGGLQSWQWLLLAQSVPVLLAGAVAYAYLEESPEHADWLSPYEQLLIEQDLARDEAALVASAPLADAAVLTTLLRDPALGLLAAANLLLSAASGALAHWAPALLQRATNLHHWPAGSLSVLLNLAAVAAMIAIGHDADRRRERRGHFLACMVLAAGSLALAIAAHQRLPWALAGLTLAWLAIMAAAPLLLVIVADLLSRRRAPAGIALIISCGLAGSACGPALSALMLGVGGSAAMLAVLIAMYLTAGAILLLALRLAPRRGGPDAHQGRSDKMARR